MITVSLSLLLHMAFNASTYKCNMNKSLLTKMHDNSVIMRFLHFRDRSFKSGLSYVTFRSALTPVGSGAGTMILRRVMRTFWNTSAHRCSPKKSRISSSITEDTSTHFSLPVLKEENANERAVLCK